MKRNVFVAIALGAVLAGAGFAAAMETHGAKIARIVEKIQKADYEGDRKALERLHGELAPYLSDPEFAARVGYWRGFAKWRRALNGFNETPAASDRAEDLKQAVSDFNGALAKQPGFVDAKIAAASCLGSLLFVNGNTPEGRQEFVAKVVPLVKESEAAAPENPRVLWVLGGNQWYGPGDRAAAQARAMATYQKGLEASRREKNSAHELLEPSWGEPELLMSLAWANLNRETPDLQAAEDYARSSLQIVPYWHYVRDILMQQIRDAAARSNLGKKP